MSEVRWQDVVADDADLRLDRWFKRHHPSLKHGQLQRLLRTGQVRVDGKRAEAGLRLDEGQIIRIPPLPETDKAARPSVPKRVSEAEIEQLRAAILHEDEALLVLNKPPGLAVQGGTKTAVHVDGILGAMAPRGATWRLVHRLDRDTSGLLVVAKTAKAATRLSRSFQQHDVKKLYWALVVGLPPLEDGIIDKPVAKQTTGRGERMVADAEEGRKAVSAYRTIARAGKVAAWLALQPRSGRTHQLRVHCAAIGCPILGDRKYGGPAARLEGAPDGMMLHARALDLPHPNGTRLRLNAPLSAVMTKGFGWLGFEPDASLPGASLLDFDER